MDIDGLTPEPDDNKQAVYTVSELTLGIKSVLQSTFPSVWVVGEATDIARPRSGHIYLTLKDDRAQIRAVIWRNEARRLKFPLEDGTEVLCGGALDLYPPRGSYQLSIRQIEPRGEGAKQRALRELQSRLEAEGLFQAKHKQALPPFPRHVAVVTSPSGAAIRDFLEVARRRWCGCLLTVVPCLVQGDAAARQITAAIKQAEHLEPRPDVVVITRGGGSLEDLWCFNHEAVVRAIHACAIPTISAIGHEIDVTLADRVADVRALTPTEAAERVVPDQTEMLQRLKVMLGRMHAVTCAHLEQERQRVRAIATRRVFRAPLDRIHELSRRLDELEARSVRATQTRLHRHGQRLHALSGRLEALSPLSVLARGYSYTQLAATQAVIHDAQQLAPGDQVITTLKNGRFTSTVERIDAIAGADNGQENGA